MEELGIFFLVIFGSVLVRNFLKLSDIFFRSTVVSFIVFNEFGTKLFLFLGDAIDFVPSHISEELDLYHSK